jgi:hypothetical protein
LTGNLEFILGRYNKKTAAFPSLYEPERFQPLQRVLHSNLGEMIVLAE